MISRNAESIKKDIVDELYWDPRVDASNILVTVDDGNVVLNGSVPTYFARKRTEKDIWKVRGVFSIENNIKVKIPSVITASLDKELKKLIEKLFKWNIYVSTINIEVNVANGIVKLDGSVESFWEKVYINELLSNLTSISDIVNNLAIVPTESIEDQLLADIITTAIKRNQLIDPKLVIVKVNNGKVTLSGTVTHRYMHDAALNVVLNTSGVKEIEDTIVLKKK